MYVALVEVKPTRTDSLGAGITGGYVRCYAPASGPEEALTRIGAELLKVGAEVVQVEWCVASEEVEWEDPASEDAAEHIHSAEVKNGPVFGEFHVWSAEEGDDDGD